MRVHLVDGTYELFRAHFSKRPSHPVAGAERKATVAFASAMIALLHDAREAVSHAGVAFDNPIRSFRNDLYGGYKTEEGVPAELLAQFDAVEEAARALGLVVWSMDHWEADDALAAAAAKFALESSVDQVRILTPDKDLAQMVRGTRVVQVDRMRNREIDEAAVVAQRGVAPAQIADWLALVGDAADGYPGLPGFGEKTAAHLLRAFGSIEAIPLASRTWPEPSPRGSMTLAATLAARRDDALLFRRLATLDVDAPIPESLDELAFDGVPRGAFTAWCTANGAKSLVERVTRWAPPAD